MASAKKVVEPFNIHLDAFWEDDLKKVERMIRKLDEETLKKLYGMTINITDEPFFPHPKTGEPIVGDTRFSIGKPYLIILGKDPTPRILYHEVAHAIGIEDETEAMNFAKEKERADNPVPEEYGTCYEDAWRFLIKEEEGELIHGTVESLGRRIGHAWVELPTGFIWEPESRQFIKKADFQAMAKPQEKARYSVTEAAIMLARVGKHGPWSKEEKEEFLKKDNPAESRLEPWQMPKEDFVKIYLDRFKSMLSKEAFARVTQEELQKEREEAIDYHRHTIRQALATSRPVPSEVLRDYPKFGEKIAKELNLRYDGIQEEIGMQFTDIHGTGSTFYATSIEDAREQLRKKRRLFGMAEGGNPMGKVITKEEAIGLLERLSMTPGEAARSLVADEAERREIMQTVQQRVKGEQNKWAPMDPREGPPLPRVFAGLRWPWRK